MPKEYRTIQEVAGPLMLVRGVENVTYDELGEIELASGETRRCKVLELSLIHIWRGLYAGRFRLPGNGKLDSDGICRL